jgi:hypothetical protein
MRLFALLALALAASTPACATTDRGPVTVAPDQTPATQFPVSVVIEHPDGRQYPMFAHGGSSFVAGEHGERYGIRLINRSARRVEAVVSVDGRDVISGEPGSFKTQRGYVIAPFGSVVVDGFRQSLDHVAAFRFTHHGDSYAARRGAPQHVGVIGVAVFEERQTRKQRNRKAFAAPTQATSPAPAPVAGDSFPSAPERHSADFDAPTDDFEAPAAAEAGSAPKSAPRSDSGSARGGSTRFAPPAGGDLGTQYGETTSSHVQEVDFKRRRNRKPELLFTLHYDSAQGLAARGVPVFGPQPVTIAADPFPGR